jgi:hypothetical protein
MKHLMMKLPANTCHFLLLRPTYLPQRYILWIPSPCSSFNFIDQVSHPFNTTRKITTLNILTITGPKSSYTRQWWAYYKAMCRAQFYMLFYNVLCNFFQKSFHFVAAQWNLKGRNFRGKLIWTDCWNLYNLHCIELVFRSLDAKRGDSGLDDSKYSLNLIFLQFCRAYNFAYLVYFINILTLSHFQKGARWRSG